MTKSFARAQLRRYQQFHPWAKKLPKAKVKDSMGYHPCAEDHGLSAYNAYWDRIEGDGSWAIVFDTSRKGEWLWELADNGWVDHVCSECKFAINTDFHVGLGPEYNHCPRCGADMTVEHGITFTDNSIIVH
jgi:rubrerythrin